MANSNSNNLLPPPVNVPMSLASGQLSQVWVQWYLSLYNISNSSLQVPTYILNVASPLLANAQVLSELSTGFLKVTTSNGVLSSTGSTLIRSSDLTTTGVSAATYTVQGQNLFAVGADGRLTGANSITLSGIVPGGSAGGDLGGTYPNPTVLSIADVTTGVLTPANGGTGVANTKTITLGGNLVTSGAYNLTFVVPATGSYTLPAAGTLVNSAVTTLSSLVSIGTITTGTWHGTNIDLANYVTGILPAADMPALTGDITTSSGAVATTLATVNTNIGTYNNITINAKGLATAGSNTAYLTGNQTITLSGGVTGSGTTAITTTVVTNANLTGPITSSGNATSIAAQTGTGTKFVVDTSPTIKTPTETLPIWVDSTDTTKAMTVLLSGATTGKTLTLSSSHTLARTWTLQDATDTFVGRATTDTLTNKTLTSPTMTTPVLGTPTSGVLTNCTGTASGLTSGNVTTNANLTGPITSVGNATSIASQTGTGTKFVVDTSPTIVTPVIAQINNTSTGRVSIQGTGTNNTPTAGNVGELISSVINSASPVTATANTATDVTSITLTKGDWNVWANVALVSTATTQTGFAGWISSTSATFPDPSVLAEIRNLTSSIQIYLGLSVPMQPFQVTTSTTIYLDAYVIATSGSGTVCGAIYARRAS